MAKNVFYCFIALCLLTGIFLALQKMEGKKMTPTNEPGQANLPLTQEKRLNPYKLDGPAETEIEGPQITAIFVALTAFQQEPQIPMEKKKFENYRLQVRQDRESFFVSFQAKRDPNKIYVGGETEVGVDITYVINKKEWSVKERVFYK